MTVSQTGALTLLKLTCLVRARQYDLAFASCSWRFSSYGTGDGGFTETLLFKAFAKSALASSAMGDQSIAVKQLSRDLRAVHPDDMSVPSSIPMTCLYYRPSRWHVCSIVHPNDMSASSSMLTTCLHHRPSRWHVCTIIHPDDMSTQSSIPMTCLYHHPSWWHVYAIIHPDDMLYHHPLWWHV